MKDTIKHITFIIIILACIKYSCLANEGYEEDQGEEISKTSVNVNATVDKAKITIGDKIRYKITVDSSGEIEVVTPEIGNELGGLTVVDTGAERFERDEGTITLERWYVLETYNTGSYVIPAIEIKYKDKTEERETKTPEIFIEVLSTLDENAADIRDIGPPVSLNKSYYRLYIIIAIVLVTLAIAGVVILFLYRRKHKKVDFIPAPLPAHEIAYDELERLRSLHLISKGQTKEYYYRLSNIVRHYIENRFRLMAPERTTEEFLTEMAVTDKLEETHKELVGNFLEHCDLVKFAGYAPVNEEIENAYDSAKKLVDETREVLEPVQTDSPGGKVGV